MRARVALLAALVAGCGSGNAVPGFHQVPTGIDPTIWAVTFDADSTPYLMTTAGVLRLEGSSFVPYGPPTLASAAQAFNIGPDGTMYAGGLRAAPGATVWEPVALPGDVEVIGGVVTATDGARYAIGRVFVSGGFDDRHQLFRQVDDGPWVAIGPETRPVTSSVYGNFWLHVDGVGGVWFETNFGELYVAHGDTVEYVFRSPRLDLVGNDGTLHYFTGARDDVPGYNPILAVQQDGSEQLLTRGRCVDAALPCPVDFNGAPEATRFGVLARDSGTFFQVSGETTVISLPPGESSWRPVADLTAVYAFGPPQLYVAPDGTLWATALSQISGIDPDGGFSYLYSYVFRIDD